MNNFIDMCNENAGVIAFIQTVTTLFISVLAVWVSIKMARLPFRKRLDFNTALNYDQNGNYAMELYIANTGNMAIFIKFITVEYNGGVLAHVSMDESDQQSFLLSQKILHICFPLYGCNANEKKECGQKIKIVVEDSTGKKFVNKIGWAVG